MIWLNKQEVSAFNINSDLVAKYKSQGDIYLIDLKRQLSKQLVYYILYTEYQEFCNTFFDIIGNLLESTYTQKSDLDKDYAAFEKQSKQFVKSCEGFVQEYVLENVRDLVDKIVLLIQKLTYIADNICVNKDAEDF